MDLCYNLHMDKKLAKTVLKNLLPGSYDLELGREALGLFIETVKAVLYMLIRPLMWLTFPISFPLAIWAAHVSHRHHVEAMRRADKGEWN